MDRRGFFRTTSAFAVGGLTAGSVAACGRGGGGAPAGASGAGTAGASGTGTATTPNAAASARASAAAADWSALGRGLAGKLVRPGDADYGTARLLFDPRFDALRPAGIAYCENTGDVAECLAFARRFAVSVTARSGGHSYAGYSSGPGLVIDVTRLNTLTDVGSGTARVGAGTRLVDLYAGLDAHGVTVPGGSCPTVGVAGLALGGGIGVVTRAYGTLSDNLTSVQLVTPDGTVRECDAERDADLFWACRGGGGGNFGVATAFTFATHPALQMVLFFLNWPWSQASRVITAWQGWAPDAPDELWSNLHALSSPGGGAGPTPTIQVGGTYLGTLNGAQALIGQLVDKVGSAPQGQPFVSSHPHAMMIEAGCAQLSTAQCHLPWQNPAGTLRRESEFAKSHIFTRALSGPAVSAIVAAVERRQRLGGGGQGGVAFDALGGAVNRVAPDATAFAHRDGLFVAQFTTTWSDAATPAQTGAQQDWLRGFHQSMAPYASGQAYQNYLDPELANWQQAYYGANYPRLLQVREKYDPEHVFNLPQGIGAA
ncbi:FAD-binding oxidoreductase [Actinocrinis puniceicyclus]|uniref:FAD-binding oxidoreductase n=1 Tax=Actinocrinis puniceicyclus TaxID=977794 RepID=A0A8J8BBA9_9ACTN|nr:FAD-binding oxidoreductase [Actinocrinis puniceicyclus]MBS2962260.1 FAD-binding oxidoreductase [Actinocrinis puniceicyclus]